MIARDNSEWSRDYLAAAEARMRLLQRQPIKINRISPRQGSDIMDAVRDVARSGEVR